MPTAEAQLTSRERLLDEGLSLLLTHGYNSLGVQALLQAADVPKGSFYHHFRSKQDFALAVIDRYMDEVHAGLDVCLNASDCPPLQRIRRFFELSRDKYGRDGYLGCMLGGLGQELSGVNETFRSKIEGCFSHIAERFAACIRTGARGGRSARRDGPARSSRPFAELLGGRRAAKPSVARPYAAQCGAGFLFQRVARASTR
jgi:TetR/AcrR family transcriptional regulator, transcriptional repressor for nem operon